MSFLFILQFTTSTRQDICVIWGKKTCTKLFRRNKTFNQGPKKKYSRSGQENATLEESVQRK